MDLLPAYHHLFLERAFTQKPAIMPQAMKMFSKPLTDTDIIKRLAIPVRILSSLPDFNGSHAVTIPLMYGTKMWPIVCSVRKTGYKKPVFSGGGWRNFVIRNDLHVGEQLTMFKVQDEAGSFHYRVEMEKLPIPSVAHSAQPLSLNNEQEQQPKVDAPVKQEAVDHVLAKSPGVSSDEATSKPHSRPDEHETEMKLFGMAMGILIGEPSLHPCYKTKEERDIKAPCDINMGGSLCAHGVTSQAAGEPYSKTAGRLISLDLVLGQQNPYVGAVNLDLTLAQPIAC